MGLRHEGKSLAWNSGGGPGSLDRMFRTTTLGSGLQVRRPRSTGQNLPIFNCFYSLLASVQFLTIPSISGRWVWRQRGIHSLALRAWPRQSKVDAPPAE